MVGFFGRVRLPRTPFSRRSVGKTPNGTSAGRSSAGCGKTSTTRRSCDAGWSGRSKGVSELGEFLPTPHLRPRCATSMWGVSRLRGA
jgi:hypothetical protein